MSTRPCSNVARFRRWAQRLRAGALLAAVFQAGSITALAQEEPIETLGRKEFRQACAACHGESGRGDGLVADLLLVRPPDLTAIASRHGGEFPAEWVYRVIDGRNSMRAHGSMEMPIWGDRYRAEALAGLPLPLNVSADAIVHGRILSLVFYLEQIQED